MADAQAPQATPTTGPELVERARALTALLAEHAAEAERLRKPVDAVIQALEQAEIFKLMSPRAYGGLELDMDTFFEVGVALGEGDASMAWVANFYVEHVWILCLFPESFQRELFRDRSYVLAPAMISPTGQATRVRDGWRLNGRWEWGTGVMHGEWVVPAAILEGPRGRTPTFFALPISEVKVEDTWYVDGMVGTGSNDVVIEDAFVPADRVLSFADMIPGNAPGSSIHDGPLYRTPMLPVLALAAAMPALGQARSCVRMFRERLETRPVRLGSAPQGDLASAQMRLARAELETREAELLLRHMVEEVCELRNQAGALDRVRWATTLAFAVNQCKRAIQLVAEASGAHSHFQSHPMQRALRDINMISCHIVFDLDARLELYGKALLGKDLTGALV